MPSRADCSGGSRSCLLDLGPVWGLVESGPRPAGHGLAGSQPQAVVRNSDTRARRRRDRRVAANGRPRLRRQPHVQSARSLHRRYRSCSPIGRRDSQCDGFSYRERSGVRSVVVQRRVMDASPKGRATGPPQTTKGPAPGSTGFGPAISGLTAENRAYGERDHPTSAWRLMRGSRPRRPPLVPHSRWAAVRHRRP